jgi:hypothetical protein
MLLCEYTIELPRVTEASKHGPATQQQSILFHRFAILEPVAHWISRTSQLDISFADDGLQVKRKTAQIQRDAALLRSKAVLFSAVVLLSKASLPSLECPNWSHLPRPALDIVQGFLIGACAHVYVIKVTGTGLVAANGMYHSTSGRQLGGKVFLRAPDEVSSQPFVIKRAWTKRPPGTAKVYPLWAIQTAQKKYIYQTAKSFARMPDKLVWLTMSMNGGVDPAPECRLVI